MGLDVSIYFKTTDGEMPELEWDLPDRYSIQTGVPEYIECEGATHEIDTGDRYYWEHYERGCWPDICAVLMLLHACPTVEKIWYGNDCTDSPPECSPERVLELSAYFMKHGNRPWRNP